MNDRNIHHVRILDPSLADRIAAGEVVERPASVVKELLENSLDAGATKLTVRVEGYGAKRILVSDDGHGMDREDARLAVMRHATSKIRNENDLFAIDTLGFRGEALPSIASVSLFTLSTRGESETGTRLVIEGGELRRTEEVAYPRGTEIEVRELFYNTPARKKFMKAESTELAAITDVVQRVALARPDVRILYSHNDRELLNAPAGDLFERAAAIFGKKVYPKLFPVSGERGGLRLNGLISAPDHHRPSPSQFYLFLNGRPIRDRSLTHAATSAYGTLLEPKRFPAAVLMLEIPHDIVDVNVHPTKHEVRFRDARLLYRFIQETVRESIGRSPWLGGVGTPSGERRTPDSLPERVRQAIFEHGRRASSQSAFPLPGGKGGARSSTDFPPTERPLATEPAEFHGECAPPGLFSSFPVLAQLHNSYILVHTPNGLGLIDQHAAHERITFERLRKAHQAGEMRRQMLLFPVRMDLDAIRLAAFREHAEEIRSLGFDLEEFGGDSIQVRAIPDLLAGSDAEALLRELLDDYALQGGSRMAEDSIENRLATLACHASVRANHALNYEQMNALLHQMDAIDFAAACPHGRPVFIEIGLAELEKRFGRRG